MKTIQEDIKSGAFRPVYLLYGEESFLRRTYKNRLKEAIAGDDTMNYHYFEGRGASVDEVLALAQTLPFFAPYRLIVVENSGWFQRGPEALVSGLEDLPETTKLVFVEAEVDKRGRLYKRVSALGHAAECKRQTGAELKRWTARGFQSYGKKIRESTLELFLMKTGDEMENIRREIDKLAAYTGEREEITDADVEAITTTQLSNRIFDMIGEVTQGRPREAFALYADLLALKEPPMRILFLLARQFHLLLQVKELSFQGLDKKEIAAACKMQPFAVTRAIRQASGFSSEELQESVRRCLELEEAVKRGELKDQLAVELLITQLSRRK